MAKTPVNQTVFVGGGVSLVARNLKTGDATAKFQYLIFAISSFSCGNSRHRRRQIENAGRYVRPREIAGGKMIVMMIVMINFAQVWMIWNERVV